MLSRLQRGTLTALGKRKAIATKKTVFLGLNVSMNNYLATQYVMSNLKCCFCNATLGSKTDQDCDKNLLLKCPKCSSTNFLILRTEEDGIEKYEVNDILSKIKAEKGD